jgi:hypothetical protein
MQDLPLSPDLQEAAHKALGGTIAARFLAHCATSPLPPPEALLGDVDAYLKILAEEFAHNKNLDVDLACNIALACQELVAHAAALGPGTYPLVVGAVAYFLDTDDGDHDLFSSHGLIDDAQVLAWVVGYLGLEVDVPGLEDKPTNAAGV